MNNWKVISQIASMSGIVFIIFAAVNAVVTYESIILSYSMFVPTSFIIVSVFSSMIPYLMLAVISFIIAIKGAHAAKEEPIKEASAAGQT